MNEGQKETLGNTLLVSVEGEEGEKKQLET
jgi:hypothetical protein